MAKRNLKPKKPRNWPRDIGVALMLFGFIFTAIMAWALWAQSSRLRDFPSVGANVTWKGELCEMAYRSGKSSYTSAAVISCTEVADFKTQNAQDIWRSTPQNYVKLAYQASAAAQEKLVQAAQLEPAAQHIGRSVSIHVNPVDPTDVEMPFTAAGKLFSALWLAAGLAGLILGLVLFRIGLRREKT